MKRAIWVSAFAGLLAACGSANDAADEDTFDGSLIESGRDIAERNCATCHSIERTGTSPLAEAPPLRDAISGFDIEALATDFREHVEIGTDIMPEFDFSPLHVDALMAYLLSIETLDAEE
ncbi:MAG: c-type cytochrome [Pseudomonadota bacterium]